MLTLNESERRFLLTAGFELGLGALAIGLGAIFGPNPRQTIPPISDWMTLVWNVGEGALWTVPMLAFALGLELLPFDSVRRLREMTERQLGPLFEGMNWSHLILIAIAAGVGEELLFRGWLQSSYAGDWNQFVTEPARGIAAWFVASICFGACHAISRLYFIVTTIFGFYLGFAYIWSGSLIVPITAHALYDAMMLFWILRSGGHGIRTIGGRKASDR